MSITQVCVKRPVVAWMIMVATVVFGWVAVRRIGISQMPDVDFPIISVSVTRDGAAPEVIESDVVQPLEDALAQVEGIKSITSTARQGNAQLSVELELSRDVNAALQDVQTKVAQAQRMLPKDIDPPIISKSNPEDQPILWLAVSGQFSRQTIADYARYRVKERLQTVPGVGEVMYGGYVERNVRVWIDASRLDARGLSVGEVVSALQREHIELPAGRIENKSREINVRVLGEALSLEAMKRLIIKNVAGAPIYLEDVALVEDGFADLRSIARFNGLPALGVGVKKQRGANTVAVAARVREVLKEIQTGLPQGMNVAVSFDSSQFVEESVADIQHELLLSVVLTAIVCWMFLGSFSSALNVILAIPMSLLGTLAVIYFAGFTLNTFTLLAMALAVGIVVDDAIMVMENIFRHAEAGKSAEDAAIEGTEEIRFAALSATLAVCAIFIPVVFMQGLIGKFFFQFGITLSLAVLFSYVEAITLAPARCAQFLRDRKEGKRSWLGQRVDGGFDALKGIYLGLLRRSVRYPVAVLVMALIVSGGAFAILRKLPGEAVPSQDQSRLMVRFQTAVGASLEESDRIMRRVEAFLQSRPEVVRAFSVVGGFGSGVNTGILFLTLKSPGERKLSQNEFAAVLRKELNSYAGVRGMVQDMSQMGLGAQRGFPVEFSVRGMDWPQVVAASEQIRRELVASGTATDIDTDYQLGMPELKIAPDRARAADVGVPTDEIASALNVLVGGVRIGKFNTGGRRIDVRVRLLAEQREHPENLSTLHVRSRSGALIPLSSLISQEEQPAAQSITRRDRERAISVMGNVAQGSSQTQVLAAVERMGQQLPVGVRIVLDGSSMAFRETMQSLLFALMLGIAVAYMILAAQFNSLLHPVTVLTILPLSLAGAALGLLLAGQTLNMFSMIGVLLLMGIVKKNSIILVDYANRMRETGLGASEAMVAAGPVRLRPILMTSIATLMAAIPAALGLGQGSETRIPMAVAVIGGIIVSTVLSLFVVPAFYVFTESVGRWLRRILRRSSSSEAVLSQPH